MEQQDEQRVVEAPMDPASRVVETPVPGVNFGRLEPALEPRDIEIGWTTTDGDW